MMAVVLKGTSTFTLVVLKPLESMMSIMYYCPLHYCFCHGMMAVVLITTTTACPTVTSTTPT